MDIHEAEVLDTPFTLWPTPVKGLCPILSHPGLRNLVSLTVVNAAVDDGTLTAVGLLTQLTRLHLAVGAVRPYELLSVQLPKVVRLSQLHLFIHSMDRAEMQTLQEQQKQQKPCPANLQQHSQHGMHASEAVVSSHMQDLHPSDLVAAISSLTSLTHLTLASEEVDDSWPSLMQALPRLTHIGGRQTKAWSNLDTHCLHITSLTLNMSWPQHLVSLLPMLPNLARFAADVYVTAECTAPNGAVVGRGLTGRPSLQYSDADLYSDLDALAIQLHGLVHVDLQLSVMRMEPWDWGPVLRTLCSIPALRALRVRLAQRNSGPCFKPQHLAIICR